jgi:hypothetical protein
LHDVCEVDTLMRRSFPPDGSHHVVAGTHHPLAGMHLRLVQGGLLAPLQKRPTKVCSRAASFCLLQRCLPNMITAVSRTQRQSKRCGKSTLRNKPWVRTGKDTYHHLRLEFTRTASKVRRRCPPWLAIQNQGTNVPGRSHSIKVAILNHSTFNKSERRRDMTPTHEGCCGYLFQTVWQMV